MTTILKDQNDPLDPNKRENRLVNFFDYLIDDASDPGKGNPLELNDRQKFQLFLLSSDVHKYSKRKRGEIRS